MRITNVEPILLRGEQSYVATAGAAEATDNGDWQLLVKVTTDEGLVGWSDCETLASVAMACINGPGMSVLGFRCLKDLVIGEDPLEAEQLWHKLYIGTSYFGRRGAAIHCISAIDNCLWSIRAQAAGVSLGELMGRPKIDRVRAYASTLFRETPDAMFEAARHYVERGFKAVKFGWGVFGEDPARDLELVAAARDALGPDRDLMVDPGWYGAGWKGPWRPRTLDDNIALCQSLAPYRVRWIEDFIHPELFDDYAEVRRQSPAPLAAGEQLATIWDFKRLIDGRCVDVVQPDLTRCGGLTVARQVADLADDAGIDLVPHSWLTDLLTAYSLHLVGSLARPVLVEFNVSQSALTRGVCGGALSLNSDGTVTIPRGVGLGVQVDEAFVEAHRVR
ncbi:MAG: mandelate racemase/muconate lactonizing enzyme family protein [Planctomycetaceae bacterium]|nr:mandelate racemase/muconate lactonizing enzyme family protein [Planctomycetaceae bacterium]